jgi:hypothetical protein
MYIHTKCVIVQDFTTQHSKRSSQCFEIVHTVLNYTFSEPYNVHNVVGNGRIRCKNILILMNTSGSGPVTKFVLKNMRF